MIKFYVIIFAGSFNTELFAFLLLSLPFRFRERPFNASIHRNPLLGNDNAGSVAYFSSLKHTYA